MNHNIRLIIYPLLRIGLVSPFLILSSLLVGEAQATSIVDDIPAGGLPLGTPTNACNNFLVRSFNVTDDILVGELSLGLNISHPFRGTIAGILQAPSGRNIQFLGVDGADTNANYDILLQDGGGPLNDGNIDDVNNPLYDRNVNPGSPFSTFAGESATGTWLLALCDAGSGQAGTYNSSQLTITPPDISGFAFDDVNRDSLRGGNEGILANVGVTAYLDDGDGVFEPNTGDAAVAATQTGTAGAYVFNGLSNGNYWIDVDETDADLAGRSYGGSNATGTADPRLVAFTGSAVADVDFPFFQDLQFLCAPGDPTGQLAFLEGAVLESGSDLQIGATYRFPDVFENVDALVEVAAFNGGASIVALDNDSTGVASAFQPTLSAASGATSSVDFNITFVVEDTTTPIALTFKAAGVDIDGDGSSLREFIELTNLSSFTTGTSIDDSPVTDGTRFESNTIVAQPGVSATATQTLAIAQYNSISQFRYRIGGIDGGTSSATQRLNSLYFGCTSGPPTSSDPDVQLVKRITAVNGQTTNPNDSTDLTQVVNDGIADSADDHGNWPSSYLLGELNAGLVKPGDELEYTVYFINTGGGEAADVRICDWIQPNQSLVPGLYGGNDIELQLGDGAGSTTFTLTAASDAATVDRAELVTVGTLPAGPDCNLPAAATDPNNAVLVIDLTGTSGTPTGLTTLPNATGQGIPDDAFGFFRFTTQVDN